MAIHRRYFIIVGDCTKSLATSDFAKRSFRSGHLPTKRQLTKPSKAKIEHHLLLALIARRPPWRQLSLQSYQQVHSMKATHAVPRCITGPALKPLRVRSIPACLEDRNWLKPLPCRSSQSSIHDSPLHEVASFTIITRPHPQTNFRLG